LSSYRSWTGVLLKFIFDPSMSTYSRVVRKSQNRTGRLRPDREPARPAASRSAGRGPHDQARVLDPAVGGGQAPASTGAS
jgi:hypothetical protein